MIDLYTWATPNGRKVSITLEEVGLDYTVHEIKLPDGMQKQPEYLAINPNGRIPAIVDQDGPGGTPLTVWESGAVMIYLAEKEGRQDLLPTDPRQRTDTMQWLMFQMGGVGPMIGQAHHFLFNPKEIVPYGQQRYLNETKRLYGVLDGQLADHAYLANDTYSLADIATYPWIARYPRHQVELEEFPNVKRWFDEVSKRPAVERGMAVPFLN